MRPLVLLPRVALVLLALSTHSARAQVPVERFSAVRLTPAPGPGNYLQVEGVSRLTGHLVPSAGLLVDFAHRPFTFDQRQCTEDPTVECETPATYDLMSYSLQLNFHGALVLFERVQIGLNVPLVVADGEGFDQLVQNDDGTARPVSIVGGTRFAIGDPVISVKGRIFSNELIHLGASLYASFPVAHQMQDDGFLGDETPRIGGHLIGELIASGLHVALNVGGFYRGERTFFSTQQRSQLTYRAAIGYDVTPLVMLFAELDGAVGFGTHLPDNPLEARLAGHYRIGDVVLGASVGAGLVSAVGVPLVRGGLQVMYAPIRADRDGDGLDDAVDACPAEAEDVDSWEDEDGCPETDNDGDGLVDGSDQCPDEPEDADQHEDEDGCPDLDNDGDGIRDGFDSCPAEPEDMDGDRDEDGCPDLDTDRDGIADADDQCPNEAEDADGFGDEDGCPEEDYDDDGVPDDGDECPDEPETLNGVTDEDGCPEDDDDRDGVVNDIDRCRGQAETYNGISDGDGCPDGNAVFTVNADGSLTIGEPIRFRGGQPTFRSRGTQLVTILADVLNHFPKLRATINVPGESTELAQLRVEALRTLLTDAGVHVIRLSFETRVVAGDDVAQVTTRVLHAAQSEQTAPAPAPPVEAPVEAPPVEAPPVDAPPVTAP